MTRSGSGRRLTSVLLVAGCLLLAAITPASSAEKRTPMLPPRPPVPATSLIPAAAPSGMCQCIADRDRRHIGCLASVDQCKAACGERYSFVPNAPSCPVTAQARGQ